MTTLIDMVVTLANLSTHTQAIMPLRLESIAVPQQRDRFSNPVYLATSQRSIVLIANLSMTRYNDFVIVLFLTSILCPRHH